MLNQTGELDSVGELLESWGVTFDIDEPDDASLLIAPGSAEGMRWLQRRRPDQWAVMVGEITGFTPPSEKYLILPKNVEPMMLRSVIQRILL